MPPSKNDKKDLVPVARVFAQLKDERMTSELLYALLTPRERQRLAGRWRLLCLLAEGVPQRKIAARLGMSLCKITRGSRELRSGSPAFRQIVSRFARPIKGKQK